MEQSKAWCEVSGAIRAAISGVKGECLDNAGGIGPDHAGGGLVGESTLYADHVLLRDALGDGNNKLHLGANSFHDGRGGKSGGDINHGDGSTGLALRFLNGVEHREAEVRCAALLRGDPADHPGAVLYALLRVEGTILPSDALADHAGTAVNEGRGAARR